MKPINSKERSKQLWQFVIIFFGLALIPVALIFFSYYHVPDEISEIEQRKLISYSSFEHTQKTILKKMAEIDTNINLYATAKTENSIMLEKQIADDIIELRKMDSSQLVQQISDGFENHYTHVHRLVQAQNQANAAAEKLQEKEAQLRAAQNNAVMAMPPPMPGQ